MSYRQAATHNVRVRSVRERLSKHAFAQIAIEPSTPVPEPGHLAAPLETLAQRIRAARAAGSSVMLCYGAHLVKNGLGPIVADMVHNGWITHLATNGAGVIHDWEYAFQGRSEEDVRANIADGTFGAWDETGRYTLMATAVGALEGMGYGESIGRFVAAGGCEIPSPVQLGQRLAAWAQAPDDAEWPGAAADLLRCIRAGQWTPGWNAVEHEQAEVSLAAAAFGARIPLTVHPGIGYDIVCVHPQADGAVLGRAAGIDFRVMCNSVDELSTSGVVLSVGSAVMAPQVFEKASSIANNLRAQRGEDPIAPHIFVNDLQPSTWDWSKGEPPASDPAYYLRFLKSFSRISSLPLNYLAGDNRVVLQGLHHLLTSA